MEFSKNFSIGWDPSTVSPVEKSTLSLAKDALVNYSRTYTYQELLARPDTVDASQLESYLSDVEFKLLFKMDKESFYNQSQWKQVDQRKLLGLY